MKCRYVGSKYMYFMTANNVRRSKGGSPRLSQIRTDRLAPVSKFNYVLTHTRFMGSRKCGSFVGH
jgi:hypothetical protein